MARIFISYSRADIRFVEELLPLLETIFPEHTISYDQDITGGDEWWQWILDKIAACDLFLFLLSNDALESTYCQDEFREARRLRKSCLSVIARPKIEVSRAPEDVAEGLRRLQWVELSAGFTNERRNAKLWRAIREKLKETPVVPPKPAPPAPGQNKKGCWRFVKPSEAILVALIGAAATIIGAWIASGGPEHPAPTITTSAPESPSNTPLESGGLWSTPTSTIPPETQIWLDYTHTAEAYTDTPTVTDTATVTGTATPNVTETYAVVQTQAAQTLTAAAWTDAPTVTQIPTHTPTPLGGGSGQIAFASNRDGLWEIYAMNIDGTDQRRLTNNSMNDGYPLWSPDGTMIVFQSRAYDFGDIYIMDADGGNSRNLTDQFAKYGYVAWSPDGRQITFASDQEDYNWEIYVMNTNGSDSRRLTHHIADDVNPTWSPDGMWILFESDRGGYDEIYVLDVNGGDLRSLTNNNADDFDPAWSPDGTQIVFMSNRDGNAEIYVMDADGSNLHNLSINGVNNRDSAWSPDGTMIAFTVYQDGNYEIYVMDADGSNPRRLTNNSADDTSPDWRP